MLRGTQRRSVVPKFPSFPPLSSEAWRQVGGDRGHVPDVLEGCSLEQIANFVGDLVIYYKAYNPEGDYSLQTVFMILLSRKVTY